MTVFFVNATYLGSDYHSKVFYGVKRNASSAKQLKQKSNSHLFLFSPKTKTVIQINITLSAITHHAMLFNVSVVYPTEVRQENLSLQFLVTRQTSARVKAIHNPNKKRKIVSLYNKCRNKSTMIIVEKKRGDGELLDVDKCK